MLWVIPAAVAAYGIGKGIWESLSGGSSDEKEARKARARAAAAYQNYRPIAHQAQMNMLQSAGQMAGPMNNFMGEMYGPSAMMNLQPQDPFYMPPPPAQPAPAQEEPAPPAPVPVGPSPLGPYGLGRPPSVKFPIGGGMPLPNPQGAMDNGDKKRGKK